MSLDVSNIKLPRKPKYFHGVCITGINFGMPFHAVMHADAETFINLVEATKKKKATEIEMKNFRINLIQEDSFWLDPRWIALRKSRNALNSKITSLKKEIRRQRTELLKQHDILVLVHSRTWDFTIENEGAQRLYTYFYDRPKKGDVFFFVEELPNGNRIYTYTSRKNSLQKNVIVKPTSSVVQSLYPLSLLTGEEQ
jgi:hypothetical protein